MTEELQNDPVPWTIKCPEYIHVIYCSKSSTDQRIPKIENHKSFKFIERTLFYSLTNDFTPFRFLKDWNDREWNGPLDEKIIIVLVLLAPEFN